MKRTSFIPPVAIDRRQRRPVYGQLYDWFRAAITDGRIRPGQRLPSTRSMAAELRISRISVSNAYEQLLSEGYLETFVGSGTYVARTIPDEAFDPKGAGERVGSQEVAGKSPRRSVSARAWAAVWPANPENWLDHLGTFQVALPALDEFPINLWSKLVARHCRTMSRVRNLWATSRFVKPSRSI